MKTITFCTSANFYRQAVDVEAELEAQGYTVVLPSTAEKMKKTGDFDVVRHRTWLTNPDDYHVKAELMRKHFDKVAESEAILVLNYEKHGVANYIGGNVLMEMAIAFHLRKPIFILNEIPEESAFLEEIIGMGPIVLHGKLEDLPAAYEKATKAKAK